eukprot:COSAG02_NODE_41440_length_394_cov_1.450847_1_plen_62_part_01
MMLSLFVLTSMLSLLAASDGHVTVTRLSHNMLPVEGLLNVTVHGTGFIQSPHAVCQVSNLPG